MDESALTLSRLLAAWSSAILLSIFLSLTTPLQSAGAASNSSQDLSVITQLEQRLFFQTYANEQLESRLDRLEKRVFGDVIGGSVEERLSRLSPAAGPQVNPDGLVSSPVPEEDKTTKPAAAQPVSPSAPAANSADSDAAEREFALERAKVSVLAAKEEEITQLLQAGVELWRARRGQEALEKFEQVVRLDPHNAEAHFSMGIIEESNGSLVEALASYRQAAQANPGNADYQSAISSAEKKLAAKQKVDAKQTETRLMAEDAMAAYKRGEYLSALDLYRQLDQKKPNQPLVQYNMGTIYLIIKQPERALQYFKQAKRLEPGNTQYADACQRLETALNQGGRQAQPVEAQPEPGRRSKATASASESAPASQSAMASYGILARNSSKGVVITTIGIASQASRAGLQKGDIIRAVDGSVVNSTSELNELLSRKSPGQPVQLMVQRDKMMAQVNL